MGAHKIALFTTRPISQRLSSGITVHLIFVSTSSGLIGLFNVYLQLQAKFKMSKLVTGTLPYLKSHLSARTIKTTSFESNRSRKSQSQDWNPALVFVKEKTHHLWGRESGISSRKRHRKKNYCIERIRFNNLWRYDSKFEMLSSFSKKTSNYEINKTVFFLTKDSTPINGFQMLSFVSNTC